MNYIFTKIYEKPRKIDNNLTFEFEVVLFKCPYAEKNQKNNTSSLHN